MRARRHGGPTADEVAVKSFARAKYSKNGWLKTALKNELDVLLELQSSSQAGSDAAFVLMGHGTANMPSSFTCTAAPNITETSSTSSGPGAVDCDLGARWVVTNPYPQLIDAKVTFDRWETGRAVCMVVVF